MKAPGFSSLGNHKTADNSLRHTRRPRCLPPLFLSRTYLHWLHPSMSQHRYSPSPRWTSSLRVWSSFAASKGASVCPIDLSVASCLCDSLLGFSRLQRLPLFVDLYSLLVTLVYAYTSQPMCSFPLGPTMYPFLPPDPVPGCTSARNMT